MIWRAVGAASVVCGILGVGLAIGLALADRGQAPPDPTTSVEDDQAGGDETAQPELPETETDVSTEPADPEEAAGPAAGPAEVETEVDGVAGSSGETEAIEESQSLFSRTLLSNNLPQACEDILGPVQRSLGGDQYEDAFTCGGSCANAAFYGEYAVEYDIGREFSELNVVFGIESDSAPGSLWTFRVYVDDEQRAIATLERPETREETVDVSDGAFLRLSWARRTVNCRGDSSAGIASPTLIP